VYRVELRCPQACASSIFSEDTDRYNRLDMLGLNPARVGERSPGCGPLATYGFSDVDEGRGLFRHRALRQEWEP